MQKSIGRKKSYRNTSWNFWKISIIRISRVCQAKLVKELFRFSFSYICWILLPVRLGFFFSIQAYVSWICLYSVSIWSYWSRTNPSMTCVAGAWKGRERVFFGAPSRFFRAQNPLSLPFQTPLTQANLSMLAYFDEGVAVGLCMGGGR